MKAQARAFAVVSMLVAGIALGTGLATGVRAADDATVAFTTVPVLPHATVRVGATTVTTDADGAGVLQLATVEEGLPPLTVVDDGIAAADRQARFSRWWGLGGSGGGGRYHAVAVFDLYREVTWRYVERDGRPVDPSMVTALTIRSSHGNVHELSAPAPAPVWLHATRAVPGVRGLVPKDIDYRIESVLIDGAEVVTRSQQKFVPATQGAWAIELLFFDAHFSARDALLGSATGAAISIEHPSGRVERHPLGASGELSVRLPRGTYRAMVEVAGMTVWTPVALSRDQTVPLKVLTLLDMALVASVLGVVALGLLIAGRPHLVRLRPLGRHAPSARMVASPTAVRTPCPGGCPPASPTAGYCRFCGTPRGAARRPMVPAGAPGASVPIAFRTRQGP